MAQVVLVGHVAHGAQVEVEALGTFPPDALDTLRLTAVTDDVRVLHSYNRQHGAWVTSWIHFSGLFFVFINIVY